jgi:two-component system, OmpR family, sensor kinase
MTLRSRILLVTVSLTVLGLLAANAATYHFLSSFLVARVDQQLESAARPIATLLMSGVDPQDIDRLPGARRSLLTAGTYGFLLDANGKILNEVSFNVGEEARPRPKLPTEVRRGVGVEPVVLTTGAVTGSTEFRMLALALTGGRTLVVAIPLTDVAATQRRLLLIEAAVSALIILSIALAAFWLVRVGLRPLERMGEAAGAIAAGKLSRRVAPENARTEVGRLGAALNQMLARIEGAFAEREASEERLRQFVADASHELRTPITSIRGYAELFRRGAAERPDDLAKAMQRIEHEGARMGELVDELLLLAQLDRGLPLRRDAVDLREIAVGAVEAARAADSDRPLDLEAPRAAYVLGDELRLRQVVDNLLANTRAHTPPLTPVHVRVAATGRDALVEVADEGPGIPEDEVDRIFERFYRTDRSRSRAQGGVGLGLAIAHSIVAAHGGRLVYRMRPGGGAMFRVALPSSAADDVDTALDGRDAPGARRSEDGSLVAR